MNNYLQVAIEAANESAKLISKYFNLQGLETSYKDDNSPLTIADIEAEKLIREIVSNNFPEHKIVGEELEDSGSVNEYKWIVDPIDGTIKFARGIPLFSTQIAMLERDAPVVGVTNNVALGELFYASVGEGAWCDGQSLSVSKTSKLEKAFVSDGSLKHFLKAGYLDQHAELVSKCRSRGFGDAYAYTLLASGKVDVVIEAKTKPWDIAASIVLVEEAGGKVTDFQGKPIDLNTDKDIQIIASNGILHDEVLGFFG